jgi:hypothetical protein
MDLNDLKTRSGLSGKQWDISMKALGKLGLTKGDEDGGRVDGGGGLIDQSIVPILDPYGAEQP